jgi:hypothetical protein
MMKSYGRQVLNTIDKWSDADFDAWWKGYERASKDVEGS